MNKELFFKICDEELTKRIKELPVLDNLSTLYSKQSFILMIYACFEGFINTVTLNFFELLKNERNKGKILNAHYDFCVDLYCKKNEIDTSRLKLYGKILNHSKEKCFMKLTTNWLIQMIT